MQQARSNQYAYCSGILSNCDIRQCIGNYLWLVNRQRQTFATFFNSSVWSSTIYQLPPFQNCVKMDSSNVEQKQYCEICKLFYTNLKIHLDGKIHKDAVQKLDYSEVDKICHELNIERFLSMQKFKVCKRYSIVLVITNKIFSNALYCCLKQTPNRIVNLYSRINRTT